MKRGRELTVENVAELAHMWFHGVNLRNQTPLDQGPRTGSASHQGEHFALISALIPPLFSKTYPRTKTKGVTVHVYTVKLIKILASPKNSISVRHNNNRC